ncbi:acyl-CoA dehydrogenase [Pollutimonas subterranea]|uniref:Acyl-CoA dehydrogenase n=1 Tax=Pollutimonas subterranea TaxID=2045210 RepID=A0A2N4U6U8_9BURK|nr:acyl-CoA dehydrogenase family protein [Pollutimonas subterranea]PLC50717.1 acyl-CoA dehydrogenase [Pollutimonas subterranea]
MNFELSEEHRLAVESWGKFVKKEIFPLAKEYQGEAFPPDVAHELMALMAPYGVGNGWIPVEGGGMGYDYFTSGLFFEELAKFSPDAAGLAWVAEGAALKIYNNASDKIKQKYLPDLVSGKLIGCSAISEPGAGSSVREIRTKAIKDGNSYRVSGTKMWTSNASVADVFLILAKTDERQFSLFLLDRKEHKIDVREIKKLGLNGWSMGEVHLDDVRVSADNLVGPLGSGLRETMKGFDRSRCFVSTLALGIAQSALDDALKYAADREQFGKPIAGHQLIQSLLADMATDLAASKLLVYRALTGLGISPDCSLHASIAKSFSTEAALRISSHAIQIHGAFGLTTEFPVERHFRNSRMLTIPDGTTQINKLIIGKALTGIDAFV